MRVLITGSGGFIGGHLVGRLLSRGHEVRAVDIKSLGDWWQRHKEAENLWGDLRDFPICERVCRGVDWVFNLAADMGGIEHIEAHPLDCMLSVDINLNMLKAARLHAVERYFYSSSACVYPSHKQDRPDLPALKESDAYPAAPEDGYGEEKLFSESMCRHFAARGDPDVRIARFHNVHGPMGSWNDGREKAPAAICRKVAEAKLGQKPTGQLVNTPEGGLQHTTSWARPAIDIYGDGTRTRSFMWIGDCIEGIMRIMESDIREPINLGSSEVVTINWLVDIVEEIAGVKLERRYDLTKAQGVYGRNSDNTMILDQLGWEPSTPLRVGLKKTYEWIEQEVRKNQDAKTDTDN